MLKLILINAHFPRLSGRYTFKAASNGFPRKLGTERRGGSKYDGNNTTCKSQSPRASFGENKVVLLTPGSPSPHANSPTRLRQIARPTSSPNRPRPVRRPTPAPMTVGRQPALGRNRCFPYPVHGKIPMPSRDYGRSWKEARRWVKAPAAAPVKGCLCAATGAGLEGLTGASWAGMWVGYLCM